MRRLLLRGNHSQGKRMRKVSIQGLNRYIEAWIVLMTLPILKYKNTL
jgi:hypothetical protein